MGRSGLNEKPTARPCERCGSTDWFVSSPDYGRGAILAHYCPRTGTRRTREAKTPAERAMARSSAALSRENAQAYAKK